MLVGCWVSFGSDSGKDEEEREDASYRLFEGPVLSFWRVMYDGIASYLNLAGSFVSHARGAHPIGEVANMLALFKAQDTAVHHAGGMS